MTQQHTRSVLACALAALLAGAVGCEEYIDLRPDQGVVPHELGPTPDASKQDRGPVTVCSGAVDVEVKGTSSVPLMLQGTVGLPQVVGVGTLASVFLVKGRKAGMQGYALAGALIVAQPKDTLTFRIANLSPGDYTVYMQVDANGNGSYGSGDYGGYYRGALGAPILDGLSAEVVTLVNESRCDLDFGIDLIP